MQLEQLVANLHRRGIRLSAEDGYVVVEPASKLTPEDHAAIRVHKPELLQLLSPGQPNSEPQSPAQSIIATCRRHGVALRIDENGDLVVGRAGAAGDEPTQPWPSLLHAIEANLEAVAALVKAGWHLRADFPGAEQDSA